MFKRNTWVAFALLLLPNVLGAQRPASPEAARYRARIDSLLPEYRAARRALTIRDSLHDLAKRVAQREPLDSLFIAPVILVAPRSNSAVQFPLFRSVLQERRARLAGLENAPPITLLIETDSQFRQFQSMGRAPRHHVVSLYRDDGERNRTIAENAIDDALLDAAPQSVREWLLDGRIADGRDSRLVYREMATSPSGLAKDCHGGDVADCVTALGLGAPFDSTRGYTDAQIRMLAVRTRGVSGRARADCREFGIMAQCFAVLRPYGGPPLPLGRIPRANFLGFALERGGAGALARLGSSGPDVADAIAAAAGADVETVAREWRAHLEEARPVANAGTGLAGAATVLWAFVAMLLALRSTRRRIQ